MTISTDAIDWSTAPTNMEGAATALPPHRIVGKWIELTVRRTAANHHDLGRRHIAGAIHPAQREIEGRGSGLSEEMRDARHDEVEKRIFVVSPADPVVSPAGDAKENPRVDEPADSADLP